MMGVLVPGKDWPDAVARDKAHTFVQNCRIQYETPAEKAGLILSATEYDRLDRFGSRDYYSSLRTEADCRPLNAATNMAR